VTIERYTCGVKRVDGYLQPYMPPAVRGDWVKYADHLEALGEAERKAEKKAEDWWGSTTDYWYERTQELQRMVESAVALKIAAYERENAALDKLEASEESLRTLRSEIPYVRGHLEGYADALRLGAGDCQRDWAKAFAKDLQEDTALLDDHSPEPESHVDRFVEALHQEGPEPCERCGSVYCTELKEAEDEFESLGGDS
jgi:hypothetical protein